VAFLSFYFEAVGQLMRPFQATMTQVRRTEQPHRQPLRILFQKGIGGRSSMKDSLHLEPWSPTLVR